VPSIAALLRINQDADNIENEKYIQGGLIMPYDIAAMRHRLQLYQRGAPRAQCPHTETRIVQLQNHKFWAREECAKCGKFLRWPKQPAPDIPQLIAAIKQAHRPVPIQGSGKQIRWATSIRRTLIARFQNYAGAVVLLEAVHNSGWFIANRNVSQHQELTFPALRDIG
jgi:hypothetical protein